MINKIISGGQTGADIAGIDAAIDCGFPYGGWLPRGRKTELGPLPSRYVMQEMDKGGYPARTEKNVKESDGTIIFSHKNLTGGSRLTSDLAESWGKPWLFLDLSRMSQNEALEKIVLWVKNNNINILNVAGSRGSKDPEIYRKVYFLIKVLINNNKK